MNALFGSGRAISKPSVRGPWKKTEDRLERLPDVPGNSHPSGPRRWGAGWAGVERARWMGPGRPRGPIHCRGLPPHDAEADRLGRDVARAILGDHPEEVAAAARQAQLRALLHRRVRGFPPLRRTVAVHRTRPKPSVPKILIFSVWPILYARACGLFTTIFGGVLSTLATDGVGAQIQRSRPAAPVGSASWESRWDPALASACCRSSRCR